jgi:hypothetical protein
MPSLDRHQAADSAADGVRPLVHLRRFSSASVLSTLMNRFIQAMWSEGSDWMLACKCLVTGTQRARGAPLWRHTTQECGCLRADADPFVLHLSGLTVVACSGIG